MFAYGSRRGGVCLWAWGWCLPLGLGGVYAHTPRHTHPCQQAGGTGMLSCLPPLLFQNEFYFLQLEKKQTTYSKSSRPNSVKI